MGSKEVKYALSSTDVECFALCSAVQEKGVGAKPSCGYPFSTEYTNVRRSRQARGRSDACMPSITTMMYYYYFVCVRRADGVRNIDSFTLYS